MKSLVSSLRLIMVKGDSRLVVICAAALFFTITLFIQNGNSFLESLSLTSLSLGNRLLLAFRVLFDVTSSFSQGALILALLGSLLSGVNIALAYTYMRVRGKAILRSGLYSGVGTLFAFLGIGCAACGTAFLVSILGFFGFSTLLGVFPYHGQELGYIGIIILSYATYTLSQKVSAPLVC